MFNPANLCTGGNLLSGCVAILLAATGHFELAPFALFAAMIFDFLDGFLARMLGTSGELGKQLDSLANMVSFGVAPGVIMMAFLSIPLDHGIGNWVDQILHGGPQSYLPLVALLIPFFALFRLAKFNIDTRQTHSFIGLPTPAATLFFMSFPLVVYFHELGDPVSEFLFQPWVLTGLIVTVSLLMVLPVPLFALKFKHYKWRGNEVRYLFLLISLVLIPFIGAWSFALIVFLYLVFSIVQNTIFKQETNEI